MSETPRTDPDDESRTHPGRPPEPPGSSDPPTVDPAATRRHDPAHPFEGEEPGGLIDSDTESGD